MDMQCTHCRKTADYSPLRLGKTCGECHIGKWIPKKETEMKDQTGKELDREFAPNKRNPEDKYKVTIVKKDSDYDVTQDESKRPIVTKKGK